MKTNIEYEYVLSKVEGIKRKDTKPYRIKIRGKEIPVLPNVHSPKHFSDVEWFARHIPTIVGKRSFLEIGTGTGVIALFATLHGATEVVATDINPTAVKNAKRTFHLHGLNIAVRRGDVFKPIKSRERFDVIFWSHPFFYSTARPKHMLFRGAFDYKYESLRDFFAGAKNHLTPRGEVLLGTGRVARIREIKRIARENGYSGKLIKRGKIPSKSRKGVAIESLIYSFRPKN